MDYIKHLKNITSNKALRARPEQIAFHKKLMKDNIVHGIARSKEQALEIVENKLIGYGF